MHHVALSTGAVLTLQYNVVVAVALRADNSTAVVMIDQTCCDYSVVGIHQLAAQQSILEHMPTAGIQLQGAPFLRRCCACVLPFQTAGQMHRRLHEMAHIKLMHVMATCRTMKPFQ